MTRKGVWNLQQVRDKQLQSLWEKTSAFMVWGIQENYGQLGQNSLTNYSSPVQLSGTATNIFNNWTNSSFLLFEKEAGTLWGVGRGANGALGQNDNANYSSPVQIGTENTWALGTTLQIANIASKTDGTLWAFGDNENGKLGTDNTTYYSSPVQIPGTTWGTTFGKLGSSQFHTLAIKTDGTLWAWGKNTEEGSLGQNNRTNYSSPRQIPGTSWSRVMKGGGSGSSGAVRTDGTLWTWGRNGNGNLGLNDTKHYSSPVQVPGTTWANFYSSHDASLATKTDGTLWAMGKNNLGQLGQNNDTQYSSPVQIPGTTWSTEYNDLSIQYAAAAIKTDGTLWVWGSNRSSGLLGLGEAGDVKYSSPVQVGGGSWKDISIVDQSMVSLREIEPS
tara:strand:- start:47 stop:1210 length:1164 start_codon:yes stop_codon:yes gene_type:complete